MPSAVLRVELRTDWRVSGGLLAWLAMVLHALWRADLAAILQLVLTLAVLAAGTPILLTQLFGSRGGRTVCWSPDGRCWYEKDSGRSAEVALLVRHRVFPGGALLLFRGLRSRHGVLLLRSASEPVGLRQLIGRLRLSGPPGGVEPGPGPIS